MILIYLEQPYQQTIFQCLESRPNLDLEKLLGKLMKSVNWNKEYFKTYIKTLEGNVLQQNIASNIFFHPKFGYCETLNLESTSNFQWIEFELNRFETTAIFFHEYEVLPDFSDSSVIHKKGERIELMIEKEIGIQSSLNRLPCSEKTFFTCQDSQFHSELNRKYSCQIKILRSGLHLKNIIDESHPLCTNMQILQVCGF